MLGSISSSPYFHKKLPVKQSQDKRFRSVLFSSTDKTTPKGSGGSFYGHYTEIFRDDLQWDILVDYILDRFPGRTKIFVYACSDNSETLSFLLMLKKKAGIAHSRRFLPILASDIVPSIVESARNGDIDLSERDLIKIRRHTGQDPMDFFNRVPDAATVMGSTGKEPKQKHRVSQTLLDDIDFRTADILDDAKNGRISGRSVVMFRNAWYHLNETQKRELISDLYNCLEPGSMLICGRYEDLQSSEEKVYRLIREKFAPVEPEFSSKYGCYVFRRP